MVSSHECDIVIEVVKTMARILIVDDEERIREVVKEYALISGYEVEEACDGLEAIEMISNENFDCVILDVMMPRLDGFSACSRFDALKMYQSLCFRHFRKNMISCLALS